MESICLGSLFVDSTPGNLPRRHENRKLKGNLHSYTSFSNFHNSQDMEKTQMPSPETDKLTIKLWHIDTWRSKDTHAIHSKMDGAEGIMLVDITVRRKINTART